ncbi:ABC transporter permease [Subtercola sp. YIM 133946]|uniref:ABC transporter permease n=1 Tax=Subtercola sp. YIM 133946 TaxID=3118909 RepID=UPI002F9596C4
MSVAQLAAGRSTPSVLRRASSVGWLTVASTVWMLVLVIVAVIGPLVAPYDPTALDLMNVYAGPSSAHLLGTDETGRDILSRLLVGTAPTLAGPALVVLIAGAVGVLLALSMAWLGGRFDAFLSRVLDIMFAFPGIIVAIVAVSIFGAGFIAPVIALSIAYIPIIARILRTSAIRQRNLPYIAALTVQGASPARMWLTHLLPNLLPIITVQLVVSFSYAILDISAISYLGLGLQPPATDWGLMVASGQPAVIAGHPGQSISAAVVIVITVVALNLIGDRLGEHFDVEQR